MIGIFAEDFLRVKKRKGKETVVLKKKLTSREYKILKLVALNYSNKEIAKELYISESTVKTEIHSMMIKLNALGRVHLAVIAYKDNLIEV